MLWILLFLALLLGAGVVVWKWMMRRASSNNTENYISAVSDGSESRAAAVIAEDHADLIEETIEDSKSLDGDLDEQLALIASETGIGQGE